MSKKGSLTTNKDLNSMIADLQREGWTVHKGRHIKLRSPGGRLVMCGISISDWRGPLNVIAQINRIKREEAA